MSLPQTVAWGVKINRIFRLRLSSMCRLPPCIQFVGCTIDPLVGH